MKHKPRPLNAQKLGEIALAYVARYATSSAKLAAYLQRKLRERGWEEEDGEPDVAGLVGRYQDLGYVDDATYARSRSDGLLQRGYGKRRIDQALQAAGIDSEIRDGIAPGDAALRRAALAMARKRRFGPFGAERPDRDRQEKQLAAMLRAGHGFHTARALVSAPNEEAAEQWAISGEE